MSSRPSTYHLETLAENRLLQDKVQTLQKDICELCMEHHKQSLQALEEGRARVPEAQSTDREAGAAAERLGPQHYSAL